MIFLLLFSPPSRVVTRNRNARFSLEAKIARGKKKWSIFLFFRSVFERNRKGWDPRGRCPLVPPPRRNGRNGGRRKIFDFLALFIYRSPRKISYPRRSRLERRQLARRPFLRHPLLLFHARPSKEFEPCTYPSFIRFHVATAEQGSSPSSPPRFILYRSMDGVSLSFMDDGFFRRIDEKNFRRGGEMTTLIVRISLEIGATKLIHEIDERHNFEKTISSSRQLSRAFSFSFFVFNFTFGNRASKLADYFIVRHIAVPE